jgi:hypothetical protein
VNFSIDDDEKGIPNLGRREKKQTASFITVGVCQMVTHHELEYAIVSQSTSFTQFSRNEIIEIKEPLYHFQLILCRLWSLLYILT